MDIAQHFIRIKPFIFGKYGAKYKNLVEFLPDYSGYCSKDYDKKELLVELDELVMIEPQYEYRWNQFSRLVGIAIENKIWIYLNTSSNEPPRAMN